MYPRTNYPQPVGSFVAPVIAPDSEPTDGEQYAVCFSLAWLPYVLGALTQLTLQSTWLGDDDTIDLARRRGASLIAHIAGPEPSCAPAAPEGTAPFWDDPDAADAEGTDADSEYTFSEQIEDWAIGAFVAASGVPGAAITYLTIAPRFRLLFRRGDWGGIAKIFLDDVLYAEVDTYSAAPDVLAIDVVVP